jgi:hypothetical protein
MFIIVIAAALLIMVIVGWIFIHAVLGGILLFGAARRGSTAVQAKVPTASAIAQRERSLAVMRERNGLPPIAVTPAKAAEKARLEELAKVRARYHWLKS